MWTVIYIAPNMKIAEKLKEVLAAEGILVNLKEIGSVRPGKSGSVELLVSQSEAEEAHEILSQALSR